MRRTYWILVIALVSLSASIIIYVQADSSDRQSLPSTTSVPPAAPVPTSTSKPQAKPVVVIAAGDIACQPSIKRSEQQCHMAETAALVEASRADAVLTLGDNQYDRGELANFLASYGPTWGRFKDITRPAPGNHEFGTPGAQGYFEYFGSAFGEPGKGWYGYSLGDWRLIALNSVCEAVGCGPGSEQERWLQAELAANPAKCTLAYWHHPRFSSGMRHGNDESVDPFWRALSVADADVVLTAHDHTYERFAPLDANGQPATSGIRQFVVGTGGRNLYSFGTALPGSESRHLAFGVLKLTLWSDRYDWQFIAEGGAVLDQGSTACR